MSDNLKDAEDRLVEQFDAYLTEMKRLLAGASSSVKHALNSLKINGYSLADLIAMIRAEVKAHEDDPNNPHDLTLEEMGGAKRSEFEALTVEYFQTDAVPISSIPALIGTVAAGRLSVNANQMFYTGRKLPIPATALTLTGTAPLYLKVNISGQQPRLTVSLSVETTDAETDTKLLAGILTNTSGAWTVNMVAGTFINQRRISTVPRGRGIPASGGLPTTPGTINPTWFN